MQHRRKVRPGRRRHGDAHQVVADGRTTRSRARHLPGPPRSRVGRVPAPRGRLSCRDDEITRTLVLPAQVRRPRRLGGGPVRARRPQRQRGLRLHRLVLAAGHRVHDGAEPPHRQLQHRVDGHQPGGVRRRRRDRPGDQGADRARRSTTIAKGPHVERVDSPFAEGAAARQIAKDKTVAFANVHMDGEQPIADVPKSAYDKLIATAEAARGDGLKVELGGTGIQQATQQPGRRAERVHRLHRRRDRARDRVRLAVGDAAAAVHRGARARLRPEPRSACSRT